MKKSVCLLLCLLLLACAFVSCGVVTIPGSDRAKTRLEEKGYTVTLTYMVGEEAASVGLVQMTTLTAQKDDAFLQVYYFCEEKDTDTFYEKNAAALTSGVEVARKNRYSIYRGMESAVRDFLEED